MIYPDESYGFWAGLSSWARRRSLVFKLIGVAMIGLLLFVPLNMVRSTLDERKLRYDQAVESVTQTWGASQCISGPVLIVPYSYRPDGTEQKIINGRRLDVAMGGVETGEAYFLPEKLIIGGDLVPSERKRGIYSTLVYAANMTISGKFAAADFDFIGQKNVVPDWDKARVSFTISDLRGAQDNLVLRWGTGSAALQPGARFAANRSQVGVHALVKAGPGESRDFSLELKLNGSDALHFVPLGRETAVALKSNWANPSFDGAYLPIEREVGADGFKASWKVSYYGRNFPQQWTSEGVNQPEEEQFKKAAFGVSLMQPVNAYRTVERAIKYGVLFIALVFTTFFLFEIGCGVRLSSLSYMLVGAALCLFYLGLLALAEFVAFGFAYGLAAAASTLLIVGYAHRILRGAKRAWLIGGMLGGVYGYLYFVLQMEDFALLAGTAALFVVLGAVMYATRNVSDSMNPPPLENVENTGS